MMGQRTNATDTVCSAPPTEGDTSSRKEWKMAIVIIEDAQARLRELIDEVTEGADVVITRGEQPVARLVAVQTDRPRPRSGSCKGMLTIVSEDDEHLKDFAEYMP